MTSYTRPYQQRHHQLKLVCYKSPAPDRVYLNVRASICKLTFLISTKNRGKLDSKIAKCSVGYLFNISRFSTFLIACQVTQATLLLENEKNIRSQEICSFSSEKRTRNIQHPGKDLIHSIGWIAIKVMNYICLPLPRNNSHFLSWPSLSMFLKNSVW